MRLSPSSRHVTRLAFPSPTRLGAHIPPLVLPCCDQKRYQHALQATPAEAAVPGRVRGCGKTRIRFKETPRRLTTAIATRSLNAVHARPYEAFGITTHALPSRPLKQLSGFLTPSALRHGGQRLRRYLWVAYLVARRFASKRLRELSGPSWDILWWMQSTFEQNPNREAHLKRLFRDMKRAGKTPSETERVARSELLYLAGQHQRAVETWEEEHAQCENGGAQANKPEHLEVGARLHALKRNADRAREVTALLFDRHPNWNPSFLMEVFRAHTRSPQEFHHRRAGEIWKQMRDCMGSSASRLHYDRWLIEVLECRHLELAKAVFGSMAQSGNLTPCGSETHGRSVFRRLSAIFDLATTMEACGDVATSAIAVLPREYHLNVFSKWMQRAVVSHSPAVGAQVSGDYV